MIFDFQMHLIGSFIIYYSKLLQLEIASELLNQSVSNYLLSNQDIQNGGQLSHMGGYYITVHKQGHCFANRSLSV